LFECLFVVRLVGFGVQEDICVVTVMITRLIDIHLLLFATFQLGVVVVKGPFGNNKGLELIISILLGLFFAG
jgi:hypothetical protein